MADMKEVHTE